MVNGIIIVGNHRNISLDEKSCKEMPFVCKGDFSVEFTKTLWMTVEIFKWRGKA